jgi:hypothetical protein
MNYLKAAIYTKFTAKIGAVYPAVYTSVGGRFYYEDAPEDTAFPFIVYTIDDYEADYTFTSEFAEVEVCFDIYSSASSSSEVDTILSNLRTLFDDCSLSISGYRLVRFRFDKVTALHNMIDSRWRYSVRYEILIEKT